MKRFADFASVSFIEWCKVWFPAANPTAKPITFRGLNALMSPDEVGAVPAPSGSRPTGGALWSAVSGAAPASTEQRFTVTQTGDDKALGQAARLLRADARITDIVEESGRWYTTPDRDDLPEWFALRVYCNTDDLDDMLQDLSRLFEERLGEAAASELRISRF